MRNYNETLMNQTIRQLSDKLSEIITEAHCAFA